MREELAELAHDQWSGWMQYLFSKCEPNREAGTYTIPAWAVQRWWRQSVTPYQLLSQEEQESDRKEADKFLALVEADRQKHGPCYCCSQSGCGYGCRCNEWIPQE